MDAFRMTLDLCALYLGDDNEYKAAHARLEAYTEEKSMTLTILENEVLAGDHGKLAQETLSAVKRNS